MQLYELRRGKKFTLNEVPKQPPDILYEPYLDKVYILHNIDGAYGNCADIEGASYYFAAWTEVTPINELPLPD